MPTTLFAAISLFAPVHALLRRLAALPMPVGMRPTPSSPRNASRVEAAGFGASQPATNSTVRPSRPLRVLHVLDAKGTGKHGGRMVISGRMADVCAELDRLAALEAVPHPTSR